MCQAHIKLWSGLVRHGLAWHSLALPGWVGLFVWFGIHVKLNYLVSLLSLGGWGWGWGKAKLRLNPAWAELGKITDERQQLNL